MKNIKIKVQLDEGAAMPTRAHDTDVGYDVKAIRIEEKDYTEYLNSIERKPTLLERLLNTRWIRADLISTIFPRYIVCHTGIHLKPEDGYYVELLPNSRWGKRGVICYSPGQIDPGYTGEVMAIYKPLPWWLGDCKINVGDVVGQFIIRQKLDANFELTNKLDDTDRGDGGFGSTEKCSRQSPDGTCTSPTCPYDYSGTPDHMKPCNN